MQKLLVASNNSKKLNELVDIIALENINLEILTPSNLNIQLVVEEDCTTLEENSHKKAVAFFNASQIPTIADDTGLEVKFLNGAPGVYSARYSGENSDDRTNRLKLLNAMQNADDRSAQFRTIICYKSQSEELFFEGICKGRISLKEKGNSGFGYDQIFIPEEYDKTFAELDPEIKNQLSHRYKALKNFTDWLKQT